MPIKLGTIFQLQFSHIEVVCVNVYSREKIHRKFLTQNLFNKKLLTFTTRLIAKSMTECAQAEGIDEGFKSNKDCKF